jgi:hypothetical protein
MKAGVSAGLLECFGPDSLRVGSVHAKITLIGNDDWHLVLAGSMNLNKNPRLEHLTVSDDAVLYAFLDEFFNEVWAKQEPGKGFENRPIDNIKEFRRIFAPAGLEPASFRDLIKGEL